MQPGEVLVMHAGAEFGAPHSCWRMHLFAEVFTLLDECVPEQTHQRTQEAFESFCLSTPWGHSIMPCLRCPRGALSH